MHAEAHVLLPSTNTVQFSAPAKTTTTKQQKTKLIQNKHNNLHIQSWSLFPFPGVISTRHIGHIQGESGSCSRDMMFSASEQLSEQVLDSQDDCPTSQRARSKQRQECHDQYCGTGVSKRTLKPHMKSRYNSTIRGPTNDALRTHATTTRHTQHHSK